MDSKFFDAYVAQIIEAARKDDLAEAKELVEILLNEFRQKVRQTGCHILIDNMRRELDAHDDRVRRT